MANTGLTTAGTVKKGLDGFTYNETADAYFWAHGDTNYCGELDFLFGTRETTADGRIVKLYHNSNFYGGDKWYCVTLSVRGEGEYWFVSNQECESPDFPERLSIPTPEKVYVTFYSGDDVHDWELSQDEINDWVIWLNGLFVSPIDLEESKTLIERLYWGGNHRGYSFNVGTADALERIVFFDGGYGEPGYLRIDNAWYCVKNPTEPFKKY